MTIADLNQIFVSNDVPTGCYSFSGPGGGDTYVLESENGQWLLYYNDRGQRYEQQEFADESIACEAMLKAVARLVKGGQHRDVCT